MPTPLHNFWKRELTILSANFPKNLLSLSYLNKHQSCIIEYKKEVPNASDAEILLIHVHIFIWLKNKTKFQCRSHSQCTHIGFMHQTSPLFIPYMFYEHHSTCTCILTNYYIILKYLFQFWYAYTCTRYLRSKTLKKKYPIHIVLHTKTDSQQTFEPFQLMLHNDLC